MQHEYLQSDGRDLACSWCKRGCWWRPVRLRRVTQIDTGYIIGLIAFWQFHFTCCKQTKALICGYAVIHGPAGACGLLGRLESNEPVKWGGLVNLPDLSIYPLLTTILPTILPTILRTILHHSQGKAWVASVETAEPTSRAANISFLLGATVKRQSIVCLESSNYRETTINTYCACCNCLSSQ
jgi:hypothetical protein